MRKHLIVESSIVILLSLLFLQIGCVDKKSDSTDRITIIDSLLTNFQNENLSLAVRLNNIESAVQENILIADDSLKMIYFNEIAFLTTAENDSTIFLMAAENGYILAKQLKDVNAIADSHWNYGIYYLNRKRYDSSYYHYREAYHLFRENNDYYAGKMLYHMAYIRSRIKDYTGSEILLFRAITLFEKEKRYKQLYLCYNLLGAVEDNLEEHEEALGNYEIAMRYLKKIKHASIYFLDTKNNIGLVYQKTGKQREAINTFREALSTKGLKSKDPSLYARILDNHAKSKMMLGELENLPELFYEALHIRIREGNEEGRVMSYLHLSQYYLKTGDKEAAGSYANLAYDLAENLNLKRDALEAILLLAETDVSQRIFYLRKHIALTDKLNHDERRVRDKFTRIHFETESYVLKNERLVKTRLWLIIGSILSTTILVLILFLIRQRAKTKALEFETQQQLADEKIYLLTLKEIAHSEQGKMDERRRISEDLHDGVLGRILGIRLNWERLKIEGERVVIEEHRKYLHRLDLVEREIRNISHNLQNEIMLSDTRFIRWMEQLTKERTKEGGFEYIFKADSAVDWEGFDDYFKTNLYRILEEALQNCVKHANAERVCVSLRKNGDFVELSITDNGKGFVRSLRNNGIGMKNMESRTKKLNGKFAISSNLRKGTTIVVTIPNKDKL